MVSVHCWFLFDVVGKKSFYVILRVKFPRQFEITWHWGKPRFTWQNFPRRSSQVYNGQIASKQGIPRHHGQQCLPFPRMYVESGTVSAIF